MSEYEEENALMARATAALDEKLEALQSEIEEIGEPAAHELQRRLDALKIEEKALKRNLQESRERGEPSAIRKKQLQTLLHYIEHEEASLEHEAEFLHAAPSTASLVAQAGSRIVESMGRKLKQILQHNTTLGRSALVNQTHESLASRYELPRGDQDQDQDDDQHESDKVNPKRDDEQ